MPELTYEELRRIQSREREPVLSKLPDDFYEQTKILLSKYKNTKSSNELREYENVLKISRYIFSRREEKILNAANNSLKGVEPPPTMLKEELEIYKIFVELIKSNREKFEKMLCSEASVESEPGPDSIHSHVERPHSSTESHEKGKILEINENKNIGEIDVKEIKKQDSVIGPMGGCFSVKIIKGIDEFVGLDGKIYGPYTPGIEVILPTKEAETLLKMKIVEKVEKLEIA